MYIFKAILATLALAFALAGCQNQRVNIVELCNGYNSAYEMYRAVADNSDSISALNRRRVEVANGQVSRVCAQGTNATVLSVLAAGAAAQAAIYAAMKQDPTLANRAYPHIQNLKRLAAKVQQ